MTKLTTNSYRVLRTKCLFSFSEIRPPSEINRKIEAVPLESGELISLDKLKKIAFQKLEIRTTPMVYIEVDMTHVIACRKQQKRNIGFIPFIGRAFIEALKETPEIHEKKDPGISIAVGTYGERVAPLFSKISDVSTLEIEKKLSDLGRSIRKSEAQLIAKDSTFTILSAGSYGSLFSTPKLQENQMGLLSLYDITSAADLRNKELSFYPKMNLTFSYDYRSIDGKFAAPFLSKLKEKLEDPNWFDL